MKTIKKSKEFNLSELIVGGDTINIMHIKEFIKRLKKELKLEENENAGSLYFNDVERLIDGLLGDKLK